MEIVTASYAGAPQGQALHLPTNNRKIWRNLAHPLRHVADGIRSQPMER
jgi:hypothetical protein